ncbi:leucyl aminopeptidase [Gilliamella sp. App2-1]|uniref:leucyl aminopeptidase n=1 Tax=Gilliamella sp. App2-1 TaxID=3120230 RepID=UPI000827CCB6|nr:leucyl aminopeptidase [Gilliamella apicola]OCG25520.1 leucyl aminopeptidase [Gilliamella apicola]
MKFQIKNSAIITKQKTECLVISIDSGKSQSDFVKDIDKSTNGLVSELIKSGDISGELGQTTLLYPNSNSLKQKILFVGCGKNKDFDLIQATKVIQAVIKELLAKKIKNITWDLFAFNKVNSLEVAKQLPQIVSDITYRFDEFKTTKTPVPSLTNITLLTQDKKALSSLTDNLLQGQIIANAIATTKTIANMPSNVCNAKYLAEQGKQLGKLHSSLKVTCLGENELAKLNMNAYLAVGRGSQNESIMTVMEYQGAKDKKDQPYVLVGKGLTFDSGGISIKPSAGMDEMKYDMCGAATVYGVMQAVAELKLPINVVGIMAGCENMPDGNSYRPGDILTTMSGTTVEVINTDAEGRLVLCDALTYVERYNPKTVIDIATLTGACIVALGHHYTGVMGNNDKLIAQLIASSNKSGDKAWALPIDSEFQEQIKSTCADIVNAGGRDGGTITAACFLSRFTEKYQWAHLDIAGTAWKSGGQKGATGRPVAMLIQYLQDQ